MCLHPQLFYSTEIQDIIKLNTDSVFFVDDKEGTGSGFSAWEYSFLAKTTQENALVVEETINGLPGKLLVRPFE